jgi:ABC-type multidrug transport system ATPase subunit
MIEELQLVDKEDIQVRNLSGGQKRKLRYQLFCK